MYKNDYTLYQLAYVKFSLKKSVCDNNLSQSSNVNVPRRSTKATGQNSLHLHTKSLI